MIYNSIHERNGDFMAEVIEKNKGAFFKWVITFLVPIICFLIPTSEIYTHNIKMFLVVTSFCILIIAFELMQLIAIAILFPFAYILTGAIPVEIALKSWTTTAPWVTLGGVILACIMERVGLLQRIAYWCIIKLGKSYQGLIFGILLGGNILNFITGGQGWIPMAAFCYGVCKALNVKKFSIDAALISLTGGISVSSSCFFFYTPFYMTVMLNNARNVVPDLSVNMASFFFQMCPYVIFMILFVWLLPKIFKPTMAFQSVDYFKEEYQKLGKMSFDEKKTTIGILLVLLFMLTGDLHHIDIDWGFIILPWILFLPGINVGKYKDIKDTDFTILFFGACCMEIGLVASYLGVGQAFAQVLQPLLCSQPDYLILIILYVVSVITNFLLTPLAILASLSEPTVQIAVSLGIHPLGALYALMMGLDQIFMPHEFLNYVVIMAFGLVSMKDFIKIMTLKTILATVFVVGVMIPWWYFIGIV